MVFLLGCSIKAGELDENSPCHQMSTQDKALQEGHHVDIRLINRRHLMSHRFADVNVRVKGEADEREA